MRYLINEMGARLISFKDDDGDERWGIEPAWPHPLHLNIPFMFLKSKGPKYWTFNFYIGTQQQTIRLLAKNIKEETEKTKK